MPLTIKQRGDDCARPIVVCDVCGEEITAGRGNVLHENGDKGKDQRLTFVHKGRCDRSLPDEKRYPWMEMSEFLTYLWNNAVATSEQDAIMSSFNH